MFITVQNFVVMARTVASNWRGADIDTLNYCKAVANAIKTRHAKLINGEGTYSVLTPSINRADPGKVKQKMKPKKKGEDINQQNDCQKPSVAILSSISPNLIDIQLEHPSIPDSSNVNVPVTLKQDIDWINDGNTQALRCWSNDLTPPVHDNIMPADWRDLNIKEVSISDFEISELWRSVDDE